MIDTYSLRVYGSILDGTSAFIGDITSIALQWKRSIKAVGGYWLGSFVLTDDYVGLQDIFDNWLGNHVEEWTTSGKTWEGMVYEMDYTHAGVKRRRTLDLLNNADKTTFTKIDWTNELLTNGDFETVAGADFDGWYEGAGIADEGTIVYSGVHSCKITSDGVLSEVDGVDVHTNTWMRQNVSVVAGASYRLRFWVYGSCIAGVRNPNSPSSWVVAPRQVSLGSSWKQITMEFVGPVGSEVLVYFYPGKGSGDIGYFDLATLEERGEVVAETDWATDDQSIDQYGRREEILYLDDYPRETAEARRDAFLAENALPWARAVGAGAPQGNSLQVRVAGYIWTTAWLFVEEGDGSESNISDYLATIIGTDFGLSPQHQGTTTTAGDCEFIKVGNIATNTLQVVEQSTVKQRAWDQIMEMVDLGIDDTGDSETPDYMPVTAAVENDRLFIYEKVDRNPRYYLNDGGIYDTLGSDMKIVSPWSLRPGVYRDQSYPSRRDLSGSFLEDARDIWVQEVEVGADGTVSLKTDLFSEEDSIAARIDYYGAGEIRDTEFGPPAPPTAFPTG